GMGKTIELIALMLERPVTPTLIVCPADLVNMWMTELQTRHSLIRAKAFSDEADDPQPTIQFFESFDVVVCSFAYLEGKYSAQERYLRRLVQQKETYTEERPHLAVLATPWGRVIVDEAHALHDVESSTNAAVCALKSDQRVACTATPVGDELVNLAALMNFLHVAPWGD
ncbi:SNF2 family N-terminal domain-containing protein, partial [Phyllosticta citribraziliensis]